jgi:hypothetical protein
MLRITAHTRIRDRSSDRLAHTIVVNPAAGVLDRYGLAAVFVVGKGCLFGDCDDEVIVLGLVSTKKGREGEGGCTLWDCPQEPAAPSW